MTPAQRTAPPRPSRPPRPSIDPRIRQRRVQIRRDEGRRRLRRVIVAVAVVVLVGLAYVLLHTPLFSARVVTVSGLHPHTSDAAIEAAAGLGGHPPLISLNPGAAAQRVEALPFIASARIDRHWPDAVTIAVTERVPALTMAGPGSSWSVLDKEGRTLEVEPSRPAGLVAVSVDSPSGPAGPAPVGGTLTADSAALVVARTLPPAFAAQVTTVTEAANGTVSLALNSGLTVQLGTGTDLQAKYEDVAAIIAHASLRGATTIDVTVPQSPTVTG
jgi:cell division protein FtsQ